MKSISSLEINHKYISDRIYELDLKYSWLASKIGVTEKTIERWVSGTVKSIRVSNAIKLAHCLECSFNRILSDSNDLSIGSLDNKLNATKHLFKSGDIYKIRQILTNDSLRDLLKVFFSNDLSSLDIMNILLWLSQSYLNELDLETSNFTLQNSIQFAKFAKADGGLIIAYTLYALCRWLACDFKDTKHYLNKAQKVHETSKNVPLGPYICVQHIYSTYYASLKMYKEAMEALNMSAQALDLHDKADKYPLTIDNLLLRIQTLLNMSMPLEAFAKSNECINIMNTYGFTACIPHIHIFKAHSAILSGQIVNFNLEKYVSDFLTSSKSWYACFPSIGAAYRLQGQFHKAIKYLDLGYDKCHNAVTYAYPILVELTECHKALNNLEKVNECTKKVEELHTKIENSIMNVTIIKN